MDINSIKKKINTIREGGVDNAKAIAIGMYNYHNFNQEVEDLAEQRKEVCIKCINFTEEPNKVLQVNDDFIFELDLMMCNDCGCALPYKTRQSIIICDKWEK